MQSNLSIIIVLESRQSKILYNFYSPLPNFIFSINKNNINSPMKFSNPFLNHTSQNYPQTLPNPEPTQSQIINTLNTSIEDLLSKILKVKQDYEISTHDLINNYEPHNFQYGIQNSPTVFSKTYSSNTCDTPTMSKTTDNFQRFTKKQEGKIKTDKKQFQLMKPTSYSGSTNFHNYQPLNSLENLKKIEIQKIECLGTAKNHHKIDSLFSSSSVKQVQASTIFSESCGQGTFHSLQQHTRQVKETIVSNIYESQKLSLSDFEVGNEVGSGKFGEVYTCRHKLTGCIFALKKIFKSTIKEYGMQSQLCLELKILYMLNHPNIVKLYAHFSDQYHIFLLMEYVEGGQLLSKMRSHQKYVSRVVDQVIDSVDYIHNREIIHRDIKPENIVIAFDNTVKLIDFGWAGISSYRQMKTTFCGTLDYVSPEMKDKGAYTNKVDLWSIGVLTFELLTGSAPFKGEINQWKKKGSKRNVQWDWHISYPPDISAVGQSFMRNLLRQNPDERASLRFCKNHFFIRKYKESEAQINIQLYI